MGGFGAGKQDSGINFSHYKRKQETENIGKTGKLGKLGKLSSGAVCGAWRFWRNKVLISVFPKITVFPGGAGKAVFPPGGGGAILRQKQEMTMRKIMMQDGDLKVTCDAYLGEYTVKMEVEEGPPIMVGINDDAPDAHMLDFTFTTRERFDEFYRAVTQFAGMLERKPERTGA